MKTTRFLRIYSMLLLFVSILLSSKAWTQTSSSEPQFKGEARLRYEHVSEDAKNLQADATTLRIRLGYETKNINGFQGYIQGQANAGFGNYNTTLNGKSAYPVVADPNKINLHQAFISYDRINNSRLTIGRQEIVWDTQRFIGNVAWRQLGQSFDSALLSNTSVKSLRVDVGYIQNVSDIKGQNQGMSTPIVRLAYDGLPNGKLVLYGFFIDYDEALNAASSNQTIGARYSGDIPLNERVKVLYTAEYANQSDYGQNPLQYNTNYSLGEVGAQIDKWTGLLGYEVLGSDRNANVGFITPLATLHKFQGWADKFLATPAAGIKDTYLNLQTTALPFGLKGNIVAHDFRSNSGNVQYGNELDFSVSKSITSGRLSSSVFVVKAARYQANSYGTNTNKLFIEFSKPF